MSTYINPTQEATPQRHCLLCLAPTDITSEETETVDIVERQLGVIYLINKLLEIPMELSVRYLGQYGNPEEWIALCAQCDFLVKEGRTIFNKIQELLKKHKEVKENVIMRMKVKPEPNDEEQDFESDEAALEIRHFLETLDNMGDWEEDTTFQYDVNMDDSPNPSPTPVTNSTKCLRRTSRQIKPPVFFTIKVKPKQKKKKIEKPKYIRIKKKKKYRPFPFGRLLLLKKEEEEKIVNETFEDASWALDTEIGLEEKVEEPIKEESEQVPKEESEDSYSDSEDDSEEDSEDPTDKDFELEEPLKKRNRNPLPKPIIPILTLQEVMAIRNKFIAELPSRKDLDADARRKIVVEKRKVNIRKLCRIHQVTEFPCENCSQTFSNYDDWFEHREKFYTLQSCDEQSAFIGKMQCSKCEKTVANVIHLEDHYRLEHSAKESLNCRGCSKKFERAQSYQLHHYHFAKNDPTSDCSTLGIKCPQPGCEHVVRNCQEAFDIHTELKHKNPPTIQFICLLEGCNKFFKSKSSLKIHVDRHNNKYMEYTFKCDFENCTSAFQSQLGLDIHKKYVHETRMEGAPVYLCNVCGKEFRNPHIFKRHEKLHAATSSFLCTTCGKTFKMAANLRKHMMWHDPEKKKIFSVYRNNLKKARLAKAARLRMEQERENDLFQF